MTTSAVGINELRSKLEAVKVAALQAIADAADLATLEEARVSSMGRNKGVNEVLKAMGGLSPEERPQLGQAANEAKEAINAALSAKKGALEEQDAAQGTAENRVDHSLPGRRPLLGHHHPLSQVTDEIVDIFSDLGFQVATGPDIETEYYNFDALNTPEDHPARDSHDTFYVRPGVVLRTHTSPVQMRIMEKIEPPVAIIVPGKVYRHDQDATHSPMFCQIEGLLVDEDVTFAELKGTLMHFFHAFFGPDIKVRFRPHFFPFTEPSAEVDILWTAEDRQGGGMKSQWLEILGCGMVHPEGFRHAGYDSEKYRGFAFGLGIDRIAMVRHSIDSIQHLYENDLRFLEQF
jgi:phenylalanyl-tRNA synthetase alpha chain